MTNNLSREARVLATLHTQASLDGHVLRYSQTNSANNGGLSLGLGTPGLIRSLPGGR